MLNASSEPPAAPGFLNSERLGLYALLEGAAVIALSVLGAHSEGINRSVAQTIGLVVFSIFVANSVIVIRRRQWDAWFSVLAVVVIFFASQLIATMAIGIYAGTQHWTGTHASDWVSHTTTGQFSFTVLVEGTILAGIYGYLKLFKIKLHEIGLRRPRLADPLWGLLAVPVYYILFLLTVGAVSYFVPSLNVNQQQDIGFSEVHGSGQLIMTFISLVILPPLTEEIMVRGLLYSSLKKAVRIGLAVVLTSAIFASAHLPEGGAAGPLYIAALDTFVLSLVLIYLREKTGSLWAPMTLHAIKNGVAFVALFVLHAR